MQSATEHTNTKRPRAARPPSTAQLSLANVEDLELIRLVAAADNDAFETLYSRYTPRLASFLRPLLGDDALIDEAINEVMLAVWQQAARFKPTVRLSTWIFGIARNKALKALAQRVRQLQLLDVPVAAAAPAPQHDPEYRLSRQERDQMVVCALDTLPPHLRAVVYERYYQSLSYEEIATRQGCSTATVKTRMQDARRRLSLSLRQGSSTAGSHRRVMWGTGTHEKSRVDAWRVAATQVLA